MSPLLYTWLLLSFLCALLASSTTSSAPSLSMPASLHTSTGLHPERAQHMAKMAMYESPGAPPEAMDGSASSGFSAPAPFASSASDLGGRASPDLSAYVSQLQQGPPASPGLLPGELTGAVQLREGALEASVALGQVGAALAALEAVVQAAGGHTESSSASSDAYLLQRWRAAAALPPTSAAAALIAQWGGAGALAAALAASLPTHASATLRIPAAAYLPTAAALRAAAAANPTLHLQVRSERMSTQDVTGSYREVVARLKVDGAALAALEALLPAAASISDVLAIKREMDAVNARLQGGEAVRGGWEGAAAMSTLFLSLSVEEPPVEGAPPPPGPTPWSPLHTLARAAAALGEGCAWLVDLALFMAVFSLPCGALLLAGVLGGRRCCPGVLAGGAAAAAQAAYALLPGGAGGSSSSSSSSSSSDKE